ncbi:MAG: hydantoinase/oxoprolinase family protein [Clostridiales bacterium]|nr:hydantoinase/oxoprolinase family protein [Clostridiales bacterium]
MIIGLDMGGTHVDAVLMDGGRVIHAVKNPINRQDALESIWAALKQLLSGYGQSKIDRIHLSTTVSTNAIVEGKAAPVGMIIQKGPGLPHDFSDCGEERIFVSGYTDHRGTVIKDLDPEEIEQGITVFKEKNIQNCAVVTKFSTRNPSHELAIRDQIKHGLAFVTMGHTLSGKLNFPRRVYTAYLNAAVYSAFKEFSNNIKRALVREGIHAPLYVLKADGGTISLEKAEEKPVETILSGPAASFMGISAMLGTDEDAVLLDIGGTTTDIFFLADGVPLFEPWGIDIGPYKTLVRAIYSTSIGLGGDSGIQIRDGRIRIGPTREGRPYAFGGPKPTPTDAMVVLGLINEGDKTRAWECMGALGRELNASAEETAKDILKAMGERIKNTVNQLLDKINARPVYTVRELLHGKTLKPKRIHVIGGPAKALAPILEEAFGLPCHYPEHYDVANAVGAALAKTTTEITLFADTSEGVLLVPELGIRQPIPRNFSADQARERAALLLKEQAISLGAKQSEMEVEITEQSAFNMVRNFYNTGQNIRVTAQVQPGILYRFRGD